MHPHFAFTTVEVLWTLTFAAQLVLLVVLLGRERAQRFPWFTASIVLVGLRVLSARVLYTRLPPLTFNAILITIEDLGAIVGLLVLVELARKGFRGAKRVAWIVGLLVLLAVGAAVLKYWGPWPAWKTLTANSKIAVLLFMQLVAQKGELLIGVLTIELGVLMALFGRRYGAGWRSHTQRILIGLSTAAISQLAVQAIWEIIAIHTTPKSQQDYERILGVRDKMSNANSAVYIAVLVWWIACLWMDEPGGGSASPDGAAASGKNAAARANNPPPVPASGGEPIALPAGDDPEPPTAVPLEL
jgi:hypothetical protein